jgi:NTP pyrophosphatase (non-canonical NTP hydrolase)
MINDLGKIALEMAISKGFAPNPNGDVTRALVLMHSEISEAVEADRKGKYCDPNLNIVEPVETLSNADFTAWYDANVKGNYEEELADLQIRLCNHIAAKKIDLEQHVSAKMRYNSLRPYKHGGKKY